MNYEYTPNSVCARKIEIGIEDGIITNVNFLGGCSGNGQGVASLCLGKTPKEVISVLRGIKCGSKSTSCPDQLTVALESIISTKK